jgi:DNA polymerase-1
VADLLTELRAAGVPRGGFVGLAIGAGGAGIAVGDRSWVLPGWSAELAQADAELRPRWVLWSGATSAALVADGVRLATCWDIAAVHRLLSGGWRADPGRVWALLRGLPVSGLPEADLFGMSADGDASDPVGPDGYLRPEWVNGDWADHPGTWAALAVRVAGMQEARLDGERAVATARSESTAELLCAELAADGLPMDRAVGEKVLEGFIGPRPRSEAEGVSLRAARDEVVLRHLPAGVSTDLRSNEKVRSMLARLGVDVPDTRAGRLRELADKHPVVAALLEWRKAERIATTYGYGWLDGHLGADGRLRGSWTGSDGAAGRMTASDGLHNMPAVLRQAVIAAPGSVFVRADLGQIEPRVLAAVSGDQALAAATAADDLYAPVAAQLGVDRPVAKVAMIAAMYGQTTGHGAAALRRMNAAYPVAMAYLTRADESGQAGRDLRTYGGRLISMARLREGAQTPERAAAYGRYARNAMIQGAAAELFKVWAVTVRARAAGLGGQVVLCLHDELLVHCAADQADAVASVVDSCLQEAAARWAPRSGVRFVSSTSVVRCWADAKALPAARRSAIVCASCGVIACALPPLPAAKATAVSVWRRRRKPGHIAAWMTVTPHRDTCSVKRLRFAGLRRVGGPLRRRLLSLLKVEGPASVGMLADRTGQAVGNVSHHLRVLAQAGLIEEAPELARDRRERWWRRTANRLTWSSADFDGDQSAVARRRVLDRQLAAPRQRRAGRVHRGDHRPGQAVGRPGDHRRRPGAGHRVRLRPRRARPAMRHGLLKTRDFRLLWTGETTSCLGSSIGGVSLPLVALLVLHASVLAVSLLTAAAWLPWLLIGLPAGAWVDRLPRRRVMIAADLVSLTAFASVPAAAWCGVLSTAQLLVAALIGGGIIAGNIIWAGFVQSYYPSRLLGRVSTSAQAFNCGAIPAGAVTAGVLASHVGVRATLRLMLGGLVLSTATLLLSPLPHLRDLPTRTEPALLVTDPAQKAADHGPAPRSEQ